MPSNMNLGLHLLHGLGGKPEFLVVGSAPDYEGRELLPLVPEDLQGPAEILKGDGAGVGNSRPTPLPVQDEGSGVGVEENRPNDGSAMLLGRSDLHEDVPVHGGLRLPGQLSPFVGGGRKRRGTPWGVGDG